MHRSHFRLSSPRGIPVSRLIALCVLVPLTTACAKRSRSAPAPAATLSVKRTPSAAPAVPVAPRAPAAKARTFLCPMDCEHGKTYPTKVKCPVCEMDLEEAVDGKFIH